MSVQELGVARRCGFVALIGAPNAGKSTLLNALVGQKVSIVSRKAQTTRALIRGIAIEGAAQIIFIDTPGIFAPKRRLDRAMVNSAWTGAGEADVSALIVDARQGLDEESSAILERLAGQGGRKLLILNKTDALPGKTILIPLAAKLNERLPFEHTFMISALAGDGVAELRRAFAALMPEGPWHYPEDQLSDMPMRMLAAEITREKLYDRLHQELPYRSTVETTCWEAARGGAVRIEQTIFVERESQRKIALGKNGQTIKAIGAAARRELEEITEGRVHLFLFVKVREDWSEDPERYREMGLEFPR